MSKSHLEQKEKWTKHLAQVEVPTQREVPVTATSWRLTAVSCFSSLWGQKAGFNPKKKFLGRK